MACHISDDSTSIVQAITGDPVREGKALWVRENGWLLADGLVAGCYQLPAAEEVAARELGRLRLADWTVGSERGEENGTDTCSYFYLEPSQQRVVPRTAVGSGATSRRPHRRFAPQLAQTLDENRSNLSEADAKARCAAADACLTDAQFEIHEVSDVTAKRTRTDVVVGGVASATLPSLKQHEPAQPLSTEVWADPLNVGG